MSETYEEEIEPLGPEKERLIHIIQGTSYELSFPKELIGAFTDDVVSHVTEMETNKRVFDEEAVFDAINAYNHILLNLEGCKFTPLDVYAYASTTAEYYLAREAIINNDSLKRLFDFDEGKKVN